MNATRRWDFRGGSTPRAHPLFLFQLFIALALLLGAPSARSQEPPPDRVCKMCHQEANTARAVKDAKIHGKVACVDCHTALKTFDLGEGEHATPVERASCAACHADQQRALEESVHQTADLDCAKCHEPHGIGLALEADATGAAPKGSCAACHAAAAEQWARSPHAGDPGNGQPAARCADCHGVHDVRAAKDPLSKVYPLNLPDTCESCHHRNPSSEHPAPAGAKVEQYETSVHGRGLRIEGLVVTATCASCHGSHDIRRIDDPEAETARKQIPATCGACHAGILRTYREGVHGKAFLEGVLDVPVCTDCHREHAVSDPAMEGSSVSGRLVAETCGRCHSDDDLGARYGLKSSVHSTWGDSYHGIANAFGERSAANCASCHGFHDILPASDARSPVNVANLEHTCGACHSEATAAFARVPVHSTVDRESNPVPWYVMVIYTALVAVMIGGFVLLVVIDLFGRLRIRLKWGPPETQHVDARLWPDEDLLVGPTETFKRMGFTGRLQHGILVLSFLLLVVTGIPVFLHNVPWMRDVIDAEGGFLLRSRLHRAGAVGLVVLSAWHLAILAMMPSARRWAALMIIRPRDLTDFFQDVMFNLGFPARLLRIRRFAALAQRFPCLAFDRRPCVGRYGLVEKLEYGAVVWGNFVMILTGAILWRPDWFLGWTPAWTFEVCRVVHGFEATLAFLAIIIWHMYHVHLRPGVFPMSRVFLNGRVTRTELRHHHPEEYLKILAARRASAPRSPAESPHE
jgi:cytochrome b subunit of formate dehydrogenase